MSQRTSRGLHAAIIMDANGRWATSRGLPRVDGHRAGANALRRTVESAPDLGIGTLTVYAFSSDNWQRPAAEVSALMKLFHRYLASERDRSIENGVRISVIGRRDRLPALLRPAISALETATAGGDKLHLRLAVDYSSRDAILRAAHLLKGKSSRDDLSAALGSDVDLLIRTGGEKRLSDFLLWECAYAELIFTPVMWPDFGQKDLAAAVAEFHSRERRFGTVPAAALA